MMNEERAWRAGALVVAIATAAVPIWIAVSQFERGGEPEKHVSMSLLGPIDPLSDLSSLATGTSLELAVGPDSYDNVVIWSLSLTNGGKTPIRPEDFSKPLSVSVSPPWEIIAIRNHRFYLGPISLNWELVSPTRAQADPFLFNPTDSVSQTIYLTSNASEGNSWKFAKENPPKVTARVVNLRGFTNADRGFPPSNYRSALVYLSLRDVLVLLGVATALLVWYLTLLSRSGLIPHGDMPTLSWIAGSALLAYAAAEVFVYLVFGGDPIREETWGRQLLNPKAQFQNWAILAVHIVVSAWLYRRSTLRAAAQQSAAADTS